MIAALSHRFTSRSAALLPALEAGLPRLLLGWVVGAVLLATVRLLIAPLPIEQTLPRSLVPYSVLALAPVIATWLALAWFDGEPRPKRFAVPRLAGSRWRFVTIDEARDHRLYGTGGIMLSLLLGILLNVPARGAEYLLAMPPLPAHPPAWSSTLQLAMTIDMALFTSLYMVAFVAALRRQTLFPGLLVGIWAADIAVQLLAAKLLMLNGDLPPPVGIALHELLSGKVNRVLIAATLWLPYLLFSARVNVTFRHRVPA